MVEQRSTLIRHSPRLRDQKESSLPKQNDFGTRRRGRSGCLNCRRRRKKCDERKPSCHKCLRCGEVCEWDSGITFRVSAVGSARPSMVQSRGGRIHQFNELSIVNINNKRILPSSPTDLTEDPRASNVLLSNAEPTKTRLGECARSHADDESNDVPSNSNRSVSLSKRSRTSVISTGGSPATEARYYTLVETLNDRQSISLQQHSLRSDDSEPVLHGMLHKPHPEPLFAGADIASREPIHRTTSQSTVLDAEGTSDMNHDGSDLPIVDLQALDYLTSQRIASPLLQTPADYFPWNCDRHLETMLSISSNIYSESHPIFEQDATHKELHITLQNHILETTRTVLTRHGTPEPPSRHNSMAMRTDSLVSLAHREIISSAESQDGLKPQRNLKVERRREVELMQNYLHEISCWLDMFDDQRHFQYVLPIMAQSVDHLRLSMLALSARQMERREPKKSYAESLALYQEAIKLILPNLQSLDTAVIASCLLLCVLEMMSASPRDWGRHLNGCAMLLQAAGINGVVGGLPQALFWCFARMDVWGGFLSNTYTKIAAKLWLLPSGPMASAVSTLNMGSKSPDSYANYAVFLCASVLDVVSSQRRWPSEQSFDHKVYSARWRALFTLVEDWYSSRPPQMQALALLPAESDSLRDPFPTILFGNAPAINGNQLYHTCALLMLQEKPREVTLGSGSKSMLWHARQICGIAVSNRDHGAWINATQPLWIAGKLFSHPSEHKIILDTLARIEQDTGWATAWRAQALKEHWGDIED